MYSHITIEQNSYITDEERHIDGIIKQAIADNVPKSSIIKLEYRREYFDVSQMAPGAREIITITNDGVIVFKEFKPKSRKAHKIVKAAFPTTSFIKLCCALENCIETADRQEFYVDDACEELRVFHKYSRMEIMDRGLGNEETNIGLIMNEFIANHMQSAGG